MDHLNLMGAAGEQLVADTNNCKDRNMKNSNLPTMTEESIVDEPGQVRKNEVILNIKLEEHEKGKAEIEELESGNKLQEIQDWLGSSVDKFQLLVSTMNEKNISGNDNTKDKKMKSMENILTSREITDEPPEKRKKVSQSSSIDNEYQCEVFPSYTSDSTHHQGISSRLLEDCTKLFEDMYDWEFSARDLDDRSMSSIISSTGEQLVADTNNCKDRKMKNSNLPTLIEESIVDEPGQVRKSEALLNINLEDHGNGKVVIEELESGNKLQEIQDWLDSSVDEFQLLLATIDEMNNSGNDDTKDKKMKTMKNTPTLREISDEQLDKRNKVSQSSAINNEDQCEGFSSYTSDSTNHQGMSSSLEDCTEYFKDLDNLEFLEGDLDDISISSIGMLSWLEHYCRNIVVDQIIGI